MASETQLMKGIFEGCILCLIAQEPGHGYRVVERMRALGFTGVAEATIYPILTRLEKRGDLKHSKQKSPSGPPRKVYALTAAGKTALSQFGESWRNVSAIVSDVLQGGEE